MAIFITDNKLGLENVPKVDNWQDYLINVKNILCTYTFKQQAKPQGINKLMLE